MKTIAILGTGVVGIALARGFIQLGDRVIFGSRGGEKAAAALAAVPGSQADTHLGAAQKADIAVLALPWSAVASSLSDDLAAALADKVVLDATNPLDFSGGAPALAIGFNTSGGETVQALLPRSHVVKVFNTITAQHMVNPQFNDGSPDMLIAGNDDAAKQWVLALLQTFGWRGAIDMGDIRQSRLLEPLAMLWISYGIRNNHWVHGFSLLGQKQG